MMKKICNLIICLALSTVAYSQNIVGQHQLRADDQVEKQTVAQGHGDRHLTQNWVIGPVPMTRPPSHSISESHYSLIRKP